MGHGNTAIGSAAMYNAKNDVQKNVAIGVRAGKGCQVDLILFLGMSLVRLLLVQEMFFLARYLDSMQHLQTLTIDLLLIILLVQPL